MLTLYEYIKYTMWIHIVQPNSLANSMTVVFNFKWIKGRPDDDPIGIETCSENKNYINICRIWGFHSGGYEEYHLLEYDAV
jgi:hypothetical protein